jgi:hypothetical protein
MLPDEFDDESEESALFEVILHRCFSRHFVLECFGFKVTSKNDDTEISLPIKRLRTEAFNWHNTYQINFEATSNNPFRITVLFVV